MQKVVREKHRVSLRYTQLIATATASRQLDRSRNTHRHTLSDTEAPLMSLWQKLISSCRSPAHRPNPILDAVFSCSSLQM